MKTKLLKKFRKRFDWRFVKLDYRPSNDPYVVVIDHKIQDVNTCSDLTSAIRYMIDKSFNNFFGLSTIVLNRYDSRRRTRSNRKAYFNEINTVINGRTSNK